MATNIAFVAMAVARVIAPAAADRATHSLPARAARTLDATDIAHMHFVSSSGSLLFEEGSASGTLPGSMRAHFNVGVTMSGSFTIYTGGGTITVTGRRLRTPPVSTKASPARWWRPAERVATCTLTGGPGSTASSTAATTP